MLAKLSQKWDENEMMNTGSDTKKKAVAYLSAWHSMTKKKPACCVDTIPADTFTVELRWMDGRSSSSYVLQGGSRPMT